MQMRFGHFGPPRILIVDNDPIVVESTAAILSIRGYEAHGVRSAEEAIAEAIGFEPDLLISEIPMCRSNGIEAAVQITAMFPDCRVLFHSKPTTLSEVAPLIPEALVYSFARKPLPVQDLIDCVATLLSAVESLDPQLRPPDDDHVALSALNEWRWTFSRIHQADPPEAAISARENTPDARWVRLNSGPACFSSFRIQ